MGSYVHLQKRGISMKIVIVGSEGFIGRTLVRDMLRDGNEVVGVDIRGNVFGGGNAAVRGSIGQQSA